MTSKKVKNDALNFLKNNVAAVVATCLDGEPHASTIYYDVDEDFNIYFLTKKNTQKNIQAGINRRAAIVVGTGPELITVQIRGKAEVQVGEEKSEAVHRMIVRYTKKGVTDLPIQNMRGLREASLVAYKIVPKELIFMNMNSKKYRNSIADDYHRIIKS